MYRTGAMTPGGSSNHGELIEPIVNVGSESALGELAAGRWVMLYRSNTACTDACREALYRLHQTRQMLGREMDRVIPVFLHDDSLPARVLLEGEHPGLQTITDKGLGELLAEKRPKNVMPGGIYLLDPLANLVMYFPPDLEPRDLVDDVKHLLKLSRIG